MKRRLLVSLTLVLLLCGCNKKTNTKVSSLFVYLNSGEEVLQLVKGEHFSLKNNINIQGINNDDLIYSSLNEDVFSIDETGNIIAKNSGNGKVKISLKDNDQSQGEINVTITSSMKETKDYTYYDLDMKEGRKHSLKAEGDQNILVLPVEIKGFEENATEENLKRINDLFNSENNSEWESVKSFYKKSSYGKLNLNFIVPDKWYESGLNPEEIYSRKIEDDGGSALLVNEAAEWYKNTYSPKAETLDKNQDGFIDAVWCIFSAPSTTNYDYEEKYPSINSTMFWPLTVSSYLNSSDTGNMESPLSKVYSWASYDFMDNYEKEGTIDAHTYIHETGHMFGLKDYYSYGGGLETPLGCIDMMDCNIGDHNPFSKFSLNWVKPNVITEPKVIELKPFEESGEFILLGDDDYNGTAFDEFFTIDYLTPTGLNERDYTQVYPGNSLKGYSSEGIRILHVDNRCQNEDGKFVSDENEFIKDPLSNTSYKGYTEFFDSASSRAMYQVTLMQKNYFDARKNVLSPNNGYFNALVNDQVKADDALFHVGDIFDLSESSSYCSLMPSKSDRLNKYASGRDKSDVFPYRIEVKDMTKEKAVIEITRL